VSYISEDGKTVERLITVQRQYFDSMIEVLNQSQDVTGFNVSDRIGKLRPEDLGFSSEFFQKWRR
jgi:hypothetical protein